VTVRLAPNTGQSSVNPDGEVCANCGHWASLIYTPKADEIAYQAALQT
jgi:hypothetical protein